jgi:hypothetical protein
MQQATTAKLEKCLVVKLAQAPKRKQAAQWRLPVNHLILFGWEAGIRTPIGGFRVLSAPILSVLLSAVRLLTVPENKA